MTSISLQDLRRSLYVKAKTEPTWRFWGLYVHVCKMETLREAYQMAKSQDELVTNTYQPMRARKKEIPKDGARKSEFFRSLQSGTVWSREP